MTKISSSDNGYTIGQLSLFPETYDDKTTLYQATNNAETKLSQSLSYLGNKIIVEDASQFPTMGILRIGTPAGESGGHEFVYYGSRTNTIFTNLIRGFSGTSRSRWELNTPITSGVFADHFNSVRDAVHNMENDLGIKDNPTTGSLNAILKSLEEKWLVPRPLFRSCPSNKGVAPFTVRFQNFTVAPVARYLWDFGDGTTSTEKSPIHTYTKEGNYTIQLNIITQLGGVGVASKYSYITVDNSLVNPYFYYTPDPATLGNYSTKTATEESVSATIFNFVDQTDGNIIERYWVWGDGQTTQVNNPNTHTASHVYENPGIYNPSLLVVLADSSVHKNNFKSQIEVI